MSHMSERARVYEDVKNLAEDHHGPKPDPIDVQAVLDALGSKSRKEILAMPQLFRMPTIRQYLEAELEEGFLECQGCRGWFPTGETVTFQTGEVFCRECE